MTPFGITAPGRILFGRGEAARAAGLIAALDDRVLLVHGATSARAAWLVEALTEAGAEVLSLGCAGEPDLATLEDALAEARPFRPGVVAGIGGGAALDLAKALAALVPAPDGPMEHLEVVGRGRPLVAAPLPFVALPTTAGTGTEATRNAVIGVPEHRRKVSLRDERMLARVAIVDPALTDGCPRGVTLASGLDAVTQVIEPFVSSRATPFTDALTRPAIGSGLAALIRLMRAEDAAARDEIAWVSLCGGLALANGGLGAVHGLAGVIGGVTGGAHGAICGTLLGPILRANLQAAAPGSAARARLTEVCAILAGALAVPAAEAPEALSDWAGRMGLPRLADMGLGPGDHLPVAEASLASSSMKGNPVGLPVSALVEAMRQA
ncbi:iron-containing alcohol dehydrogenase [Cereibacter sphaeroides]|uniref:iron-containing alcohol dehydrogenase n=1 Tax=Cereibacter sphaeroides TaxID=1063 RepID=UPI001F391920|nr:iron-containing alcohol dehydrogenase [Cereibacter sphaeroides]MCE6953244.1 iron-containing alcohol dehydrogenase [Cereibacter sphaeroides]